MEGLDKYIICITPQSREVTLIASIMSLRDSVLFVFWFKILNSVLNVA